MEEEEEELSLPSSNEDPLEKQKGEWKEIVEKLGLEPHPEGGYYRQTNKSSLTCSVPWSLSPRSLQTSIYFFLHQGCVSHLHRIKSEEIWHHYSGGPISIVMIEEKEEGEEKEKEKEEEKQKKYTIKEITLGKEILKGEKVQFTVPPNIWFGSYPLDGVSYSLVGCTVSPGFEFDDFEMAKREDVFQLVSERFYGLVEKLTPAAAP